MPTKTTLDSLPEDKNLDAAIIASIRSGKSLLDAGGVLTPLINRALEAAVEGELDAHLLSGEGTGVANRRNGKG